MPQERKYANRSEQQAAYRIRLKHQQELLLASKGLPLLPTIPTIAGRVRWKAMIIYAHSLLTNAGQEIQEYIDDRSEEWQESEKAEALIERMDEILAAADVVEELLQA